MRRHCRPRLSEQEESLLLQDDRFDHAFFRRLPAGGLQFLRNIAHLHARDVVNHLKYLRTHLNACPVAHTTLLIDTYSHGPPYAVQLKRPAQPGRPLLKTCFLQVTHHHNDEPVRVQISPGHALHILGRDILYDPRIPINVVEPQLEVLHLHQK